VAKRYGTMARMSPRIAITCWRRPLPTFLDPRTDLYTLGAEYVDAIRAAGGVPLLLPHLAQHEVTDVLDVVDGLVLSGGGDVDPVTYGQVDAGGNSDVDARADLAEVALVRGAAERGLPTLAICRGMQVLNVAFGGTLAQDCTSPDGPHRPVAKDPAQVRSAEHPVELSPDSRLAAIYGRTRRQVNTIHHQAVDGLAEGFRVTARAPDGVVEGLESTTGWDALGVQWHPEKTVTGDDAPLFTAFVDMVRT
jgi:putative glutamine amidotransferase